MRHRPRVQECGCIQGKQRGRDAADRREKFVPPCPSNRGEQSGLRHDSSLRLLAPDIGLEQTGGKEQLAFVYAVRMIQLQQPDPDTARGGERFKASTYESKVVRPLVLTGIE